MPTATSELVGSWEKTSGSACSEPYPDVLHFQENGLYTGEKQSPGAFSLWDVGTFQITDAEHVSISTAYDAIISYEFSIVDDVLTFTDPDGCEFSYQRTM